MHEGVYDVAVIGAGRAGAARRRAIEEHPRTRLAGVVRRDPGPGEKTLEAVLEDPQIDALIVCTPNLLHAAATRAGLESGKHVAVEYPLAHHVGSARDLFALAERSERVLHVEHIELLSPSQLALRKDAADLGRPLGGAVRFSGRSAGWIGDPVLAGSPALRALARLHRLVDLFGEADISMANVVPGTEGGYLLEVGVAFREGGEVTLIEERGPDLERSTEWAIRCEQGMLETPEAGSPGALFYMDLERFVERIASGAPSYVSDERVLHVLGLVERIEAALG